MRAVILPVGFFFSLGLLLQAATAAEPEENKVEVQVKLELPILAKIPYLSRLFTTMGVANEESCGEEGSCETEELQLPPPPNVRMIRVVGADGFERIGVDFDCPQAGVCLPCPQNVCRACRADQPDQCETILRPVGPPDAATLITLLEAREEMREVLEDAREKFHEREHKLLDELFEAELKSAVQEATLKAREEAAEKTTELTKELVSTLLENTKLQAKLELAEEKAKMLAELHEARTELAALKARDADKTAQPRRSRGDAQARRAAEALR